MFDCVYLIKNKTHDFLGKQLLWKNRKSSDQTLLNKKYVNGFLEISYFSF